MSGLRKYFFFSLLFLLGHFTSQAQQSVSKPRIEFFSIPNSAINSEEISDIKVDQDGYVWVVSFKGLYRFDGKQFQKISSNFNSFGSLIRFYEGNQGEKFVLDYWGALFFVRNDSMFPYEQNSKIRALYKGYGYSDVDFIDNAFHFSYDLAGYKVVEQGTIKDPLLDKNVDFQGYGVRLRKGRNPFMFTGSKLKYRSSAQFLLFNENLEVIDSCKLLLNKGVNPTAIAQLKDGTFLFSSGKSNLVHFDNEKIIKTIDYPDQVLQLFVDKNGNLWLSTRNAGIHYYKSGKIDYAKRSVFLKNSTAIVSAQDYQGGIWLYSQERGLGYISHPSVQYIQTKNNARPLVETLVNFGEKVVYGDGNELKKVEFDSAGNVTTTRVLKTERQMMRLKVDKKRERLWISNRGELCFYENEELKKVTNYDQGLTGNFSYLNSDWTDTSISLIGTNGYQYFACKDDSISFVSKRFNQKLKGVLLWKDTFYINSGNGIYAETKDTSYYLGATNKIAQNSASQLLIYKGKLLFSFPSDGIHYLENGVFKPIMFNGEVLPSANMVKQSDSLLWVVSNYGCFQLKEENGEINSKAFSTLPRLVLKTGGIVKEKLFLQTRNNGIGVVDLEQLKQTPINAPKLLITSILTKSKQYFGNYVIDPISYDDNNIQIYFNALNFHDLDVAFRYRLKGNTEDWTTTKTGYVNFVSLSANDYEFEVQARFGLGKWCDSKQLKFTVIPPFWKRWWFILFSVLLGLYIIYQIISVRFKINNREKLLTIDRLTAEQKALRTRMDPHFMFNVLSSLQYLILRKKNEQATVFLNRFSSLLRNTLKQSDIESITIKEELQFLKEYIELEKMRLEDAFDYELMVDDEVDQSLSIPPFIIQPFVENSIQHGLKAYQSEGILQLKLSLDHAFLKVEVIDNGMGYEKSKSSKTKAHKSYGIQTIEERLKIYNGNTKRDNITITDLSAYNERGTKVEVLIKLKK